ncbi:MAG TPA: alpha/beta hydrolase [Acidisarcina sp.]
MRNESPSGTRPLNSLVCIGLAAAFLSSAGIKCQAQTTSVAAPAPMAVGAVVTPPAQHHGLFEVKVTGSGPAVILIPGLSSSGDVWNGTVQHMSPHYQCHVLTLAGFGGQPAWSGIDKGKFLLAVEDELAAYIQQNKLVKPVIIGHSLGGTMTLEFAERYPELPGRLVIVDSLPFLAGVWLQAATAEQAEPVAKNMKMQIAGQTHEAYEQFVKSGASTRSMVTSDADFAKVTEWGEASDQATTAEALYELMTTDARPGLSKIPGSVLVLATWAGLGGVTSAQIEAGYRYQYTGLKQLHLVMAGRERHFIMLDDPTWFYTQVDAFLAANAAGLAPGQDAVKGGT